MFRQIMDDVTIVARVEINRGIKPKILGGTSSLSLLSLVVILIIVLVIIIIVIVIS